MGTSHRGGSLACHASASSPGLGGCLVSDVLLGARSAVDAARDTILERGAAGEVADRAEANADAVRDDSEQVLSEPE